MNLTHFAPEITDEMVRVHEQYLVPAIYAQWAARVAEVAEIEMGHHVLDVACGTGSLARAAQLETGLKGKVVGLDLSEKMLEAARRHSKTVEWTLGDAASLPFEDDSFDRVTCQFSLMFLSNRVATIKEMRRVCKPDGLVVLAIWGPLMHGSAYVDMIRVVREMYGEPAARKLGLPWELGKPGVMDALLVASGIDEYVCHERLGLARYPSDEAFLEAHLKLGEEFDGLSFPALLNKARGNLRAHLSSEGQLLTKLNAHIFTFKGF